MLARADANEGVRFALVPDGGEGPMSRMHHGVAIKRPKVGMNRVRQDWKSPPVLGKVVRPTEPANRVSPTKR